MYLSDALRPGWTPLTIALMVLGFIVFWPLGLLMLAYNVWGNRVPELRKHFADRGEEFKREFRGCGRRSSSYGFSRSGNIAFDEYRESELKRLDEERRKLDEERSEFEGFVRELRRARDREEFDRFMADRASKRKGGGSETIDL
jgi:hypothetical protein